MKSIFIIFLLLFLGNCKKECTKKKKETYKDRIEIIKQEEYNFVKSYNACEGIKGKEYIECKNSNPNSIENILSKKYYSSLLKDKFIIGSDLNLKKNFECNDNQNISLKCQYCNVNYTFSIIEKIKKNEGLFYELIVKNQNGKVISEKEIQAEMEGNCFIFLDLDENKIPEIISLSSSYWVNSEHYFIDIYSLHLTHNFN